MSSIAEYKSDLSQIHNKQLINPIRQELALISVRTLADLVAAEAKTEAAAYDVHELSQEQRQEAEDKKRIRKLILSERRQAERRLAFENKGRAFLSELQTSNYFLKHQYSFYLNADNPLGQTVIDNLCWEGCAYIKVDALLDQLTNFLKALKEREKNPHPGAKEMELLQLSQKAFMLSIDLFNETLEFLDPATQQVNFEYTFKGRKEITLITKVLEKASALVQETNDPREKALALKAAVSSMRQAIEGPAFRRPEYARHREILGILSALSALVLILYPPAGLLTLSVWCSLTAGTAWLSQTGQSTRSALQDCSKNVADSMNEMQQEYRRPLRAS